MKTTLASFFKIVAFIFLFINFVIDLLASYYLVQIGNGGWVFLAWILGAFPSLLLPLFTPYFPIYLVTWLVAIVAFVISYLLNPNQD
jgi:hypothetical protein